MLVNISQGSKLAGISRDTFYKNYINKGKVSTTRDNRNRPMVDTSEILRVFGGLQEVAGLTDTELQNQSQPYIEKIHHTPPAPPDLVARVLVLEAENRHLAERLEESKGRENWQKEKIDTLLDTVKLLEAPRTAPPSSLARWWKSIF